MQQRNILLLTDAQDFVCKEDGQLKKMSVSYALVSPWQQIQSIWIEK